MLEKETKVTLVIVVTVSWKLVPNTPINELVRIRMMLLMKTDAEVSVPEVSSPFCTFSITETTDVMLEIVDFRAATAASCSNTNIIRFSRSQV